MKIESSSIGMESARSYHASKVSYRKFTLAEYRTGTSTYTGGGLNAAVTGGQSGNNQTVADKEQENQTADTQEKKLYTLEDWKNSLEVGRGRLNIRSASDRTIDDIRQATVRYIFDLLFASRRNRLKEWMKENGLANQETPDGSLTESGTAAGTSGTAAGKTDNSVISPVNQAGDLIQNLSAMRTGVRVWTYTQETRQLEVEETSFATQGTVRTADGREINFNVDVSMSRAFEETFREDLQLASFRMCDPLVINLDTDVAGLSDQKFYFDIDADGEKDEISQLAGGSGYLALDKNGDGVINDGSELFGTASGDGFADLAKYDEDGNGWIDENDAIWSKLKIWCKDANGNDVLYRLADKGVGAICLMRSSTDFTLQGNQGQTNGAIRSTGVFLYENGNVGTVQHVDVAKYEQGA